MDKSILWGSLFIMAFVSISPIFALSHPLSANPIQTDKNELTSKLTEGIVGTSCTNQYVIQGGYCSENIGQYYQCLYANGGLTWQQRSENCGDYGYICIETSDTTGYTCAESSTVNVMQKYWWIGLLLVVIAIGGFMLGWALKR